eukprot:738200_1
MEFPLKTIVYVLTLLSLLQTVGLKFGTIIAATGPVKTYSFDTFMIICYPFMYLPGVAAGILGLIGLYSKIKKCILGQMILNTVAAITTTVFVVVLVLRTNPLESYGLYSRVGMIPIYFICVGVSAFYYTTMDEQPQVDQPEAEQPDVVVEMQAEQPE